MERNLFWLKSITGIVFIAAFGAWASKRINDGEIPWYTAAAMALPASLLWGWMARHKDVSLIYSSLVYDVVYTLSYTGCFVLLGERMTPLQWVGVTMAIVGTVMAGWK